MSTLWGGQLSGSGSTHWGVAGLGVPGATVPSTGTHGPAAAYSFLTLPAQNDTEVQWLRQTDPSAGTFYMNEDTSATLTGAPDGVYSFSGLLKFDGVSQGEQTHTITIGAATVSLTGAPSVQANVGSAGAVVQGHQLAGSASAQVNAGSSGAITQAHLLAGSPSAQSNFASEGAITIPAPGSITLAGAASAQANLGSDGAITQAHQLAGGPSVQPNIGSDGAVSLSTTGGAANPADVWNYVLANGKTAAQNVLETRQMVEELYRIHGLLVGQSLTVGPNQRVAGDITQTISETSGVVTVTRA